MRVLSLAEPASRMPPRPMFDHREESRSLNIESSNLERIVSCIASRLMPSGKFFDDGEDGRNMAERRSSSAVMGNCEVLGCSKPAERSVSAENAKNAGLKYGEGLKRVHLCKDHYRQFKKETKKDRIIRIPWALIVQGSIATIRHAWQRPGE